ncbi:phage integrase central domain-containing protein [Geodermatophilus sp. URMC 62]|uniref:phage integrase central domain-containing protein n=1 Tax=Geodermatophilus sp. URMC 62 TaxID=3423414 RepID=UPI00406C9F35
MSKVGPSRAAAERALKAELTSRQAPGGVGAITSATRMVTLADAWMEADHGWSTGTQRTYRSVVNRQVKPAFGQLCIREATPGVVSRALSAIARSSGPGAAKTARACLSGMFAPAIQDGAAAVNPVRDSSAKINTGKRTPRALTVEGTLRLVESFRSSDRAAELDLPDLVDWMLATGCRIGEALALRYWTNGDGRPILDLDARTWEVNATVVRVPGAGLAVQPRPKTTAGWRVVALPDLAVRMLEDRRGRGGRRSDGEWERHETWGASPSSRLAAGPGWCSPPTQLRLARPIPADTRLPWERRLPTARLTPTRIRRAFLRLLRSWAPRPAHQTLRPLTRQTQGQPTRTSTPPSRRPQDRRLS